ncbi:unnamed protein product [Ixodes persulcatus]
MCYLSTFGCKNLGTHIKGTLPMPGTTHTPLQKAGTALLEPQEHSQTHRLPLDFWIYSSKS